MRSALHDKRLVTVVGPPGSGKTRVAIEAAAQSSAQFADGVYFVDLTAASGPAEVVPAFVDGIGRATPPDRAARDHVRAELADRAALVVVDNCEHVLDHAAAFIDDVLRSAPGVHVLATSRVVTDVPGEMIYPLAPLEATSPSAPAVRMFVDRAQAMNVRFEVDDAAIATITEIVSRLDGMPLAIELAAARTRSLSLGQIAEHLDDRFRLLVGNERSDRRQRSLEAAIDWSYELLGPDDQRLFCSLSVCSGPFALATVARLLEQDEVDAASSLDRLVARSLVSISTSDGELLGYQLLESLRAFGRNRLDAEGRLDEATLALEHALLPPVEDQQDVAALINDHVVWNERTLIEARTRRDAAARAIDAARVEQGCLLLGTATGPGVSGSYEQLLEMAQHLHAAHATELSSGAEFALAAAEFTLQLLTFRMTDAVVTIERELERIDDGAGHRFFNSWRLLMMVGFDPEAVVDETDQLLADPPVANRASFDHGVSMLATAGAIALLALDRTEESRQRARAAVGWARPRTGTHQVALSTLLWIEYVEQFERGAELREAGQLASAVGLGSRVKIAAVIASAASVEERAQRLLELARRAPLGRVLFEESFFVVPFAWLAMEEGDINRARRLLDVFATPDPGIGTAGIRALERIHLERTGERLDPQHVMQRFLDPVLHERLLTVLPQTLDAELDYWSARLAAGGASTTTHPGPEYAIGILGPLRVSTGGRAVEITAPQQRAIITTLALRDGGVVEASTLIDAVWGESAPLTARRSLQSQISRLRSRLGADCVRGNTANGYALAPDAADLDVERFRDLRRRATEAGAVHRCELLQAALDEWRGDAAPDIADTSRVRAETASLHEERIAAEDELAAALVEVGRTADAVALLEVLTKSEPLRECRWALLVDALVAADRRAEALRAFQHARRQLVDGHGVEPGPLLRAAEARALAEC